ncbi:site-specific DNA-methyltransferase [Candidatus Peregrinibacteria bacterium]|nr:site-specific DNA-methyltransferase [Candidatus Peregrinibacteria bacterium]
MIIHGDNLLALKALEQDYAGKVKCIYIDPPYNTGQAFEHYDDGLEHSLWLSLIKARLELLKGLLTDDGVVFVQIDDNEVHYLKILLDEIFGRQNFLNQVSVKMKQTSGASGGGEDKKLKKNIEYILIYTKNKYSFIKFNEVLEEENLFDLIEDMRQNGKSWKYTRVLTSYGEKKFLKEIKDGSGEPIRIYVHTDVVMKPIRELMKTENLTEEECYIKYYSSIFRDTNAQSSIRTRVMEATENEGDFFSIEYVPKSGKSKGKMTTLYYKGNNRDLIAWLSDVCVKKGNRLVKLEKLGTYWDGFPLNNLTKEGGVKFPKGKKPELLLKKILDLATDEGDIVLDSFLGSGSTAAVAHKMNRKYIGIELGEHAKTHVVTRLKNVIDNNDTAGISKTINWQGGGGFKFYTLAPSLLRKDKFDNWIIEPSYDADLLASALAKQGAFTYHPDSELFWKQGYSTENDFIFTTTQFITVELIDRIHEEMGEDESLLVCAKTFQDACLSRYDNITLKKIPKVLLGKCEFAKDDYSLNITETEEVESDDE